MQRPRLDVPDEGVLLAAELPAEAPHQVMHGHQRLDPGELHADADPRAAAEGDEGARRRRRVLEAGRVEFGRLGVDAPVHVRGGRRPEHLPPFGDEVAVELDVFERCPEGAEDRGHQPEHLLRGAPRELHVRQVLPGQGVAVALALGDLLVLCSELINTN